MDYINNYINENKDRFIKELIELVFPDVPEEKKDGRSKYGRAVKDFLAEKILSKTSIELFFPSKFNLSIFIIFSFYLVFF